jgi:8-oxo-dGTP diphosphatase
VVKDGKVLLGQRLNAHGDGTWGFPGGHLEFGESWGTCAQREVEEEAGLVISNLSFITCTNDIFIAEAKHYITIYMRADWVQGEPQVREPDKMVKWQWFEWENLPKPYFIPMENLIKTGFHP